jgi:pentose-5-phosphate-3-epimerase
VTNRIALAPSIFSADFARLGEEVAGVRAGMARLRASVAG